MINGFNCNEGHNLDKLLKIFQNSSIDSSLHQPLIGPYQHDAFMILVVKFNRSCR